MGLNMSHDYNVGIVADWLVTYAGAERVIKELIDLYPESKLYSLVDFLSPDARELMGGKHATTTFIQKMPFSKNKYQKYLPFLPDLLFLTLPASRFTPYKPLNWKLFFCLL